MKRNMTILMLIVLLVMMAIPMSAGAYTMYVKTKNGGAVNLRDEPSTDSDICAKVAYGKAVEVLQNEGTWSAIDWPGRSNPGWIASKYLVSKKPSRHEDERPESEEVVSDLNFRSFKLVDPYYVTVQANRSGGYVNLRWVPSMDGAVQERVNDGSELLVIAEGRGWYQVQDERSGYIGFMRSSFLVNYSRNDEH